MKRLIAAAVAVGVVVLAAHPAWAQRDHFMCYAAKQSKGFPAFGKVEPKKVYAALDDVLGLSNPQGLNPADFPGSAGTYQIKKIKDVCLAANKNGEGVSDPDAALVAYQVSPQKGQCDGDPAIPCKKDEDCGVSGPCSALGKFDKKNPKNQSVRVGDQLVDLRVDFGKEVMALIPADRSTSGFAPSAPGGEHYKCYSIKPTKSSCVGGGNAGGFCKKAGSVEGCPGGMCVANPKFPKETHPSGLGASFADEVSAFFDPADPEKPIVLGKLRMFCQATDKKLVANAVELRDDQQAGLLCYSGKTSKLACNGGPRDNEPCKKDTDCPIGACRPEGLFDKKNSELLGNFVKDQMFDHRLDVAKEGVFCIPACRGIEDFQLNSLVSHVTHLSLGPAGGPLAGLPRGMNVDNNGATSAPADAGDGIDNQLQGLGGLLNGLLQEQLDEGGINLLFQLSSLTAPGSARVTGFTGSMASPAGCTVGTPPAPRDPGNSATPCNYTGSRSSFTVDGADSCEQKGIISLDLTSSFVNANEFTLSGGGPGNQFSLALPFAGASFSITAKNVVVSATVQHDGSSVNQIRGVLGGGINHAALVAAVAALPNSCNGGPNDGQTCNVASDCPSGVCELLLGNTADDLSTVIGILFPPDLDLDPDVDGLLFNFETEEFEPIPQESVSVGLLFRSTKAIAVGLD